jgi:hypothetical protein
VDELDKDHRSETKIEDLLAAKGNEIPEVK